MEPETYRAIVHPIEILGGILGSSKHDFGTSCNL